MNEHVNNIATLSKASKGPLYRVALNYFIKHIVTGAMEEGEKLPSIREISTGLGISKGTVVKTYNELMDLQLVVANQGLGYFVTNVFNRRNMHYSDINFELSVNDFISDIIILNIPPDEIIGRVSREIEAIRGAFRDRM